LVDATRELAVADRLAVGDVLQRTPDASLERRAVHDERQIEAGALARYGAARPQPCPEVLHGVGAVGAPALGESLGGGGAAVLSELLEGVTDAEVGREEGVGVARGRAGRAWRRTPLSRLNAPPRPRELAVARAPVRPNP
jgi:hypothetical protein